MLCNSCRSATTCFHSVLFTLFSVNHTHASKCCIVLCRYVLGCVCCNVASNLVLADFFKLSMGNDNMYHDFQYIYLITLPHLHIVPSAKTRLQITKCGIILMKNMNDGDTIQSQWILCLNLCQKHFVGLCTSCWYKQNGWEKNMRCKINLLA